MTNNEMKILGDTIPIASDYMEIGQLKFLKDNPRVYACTHGEANFDNLMEEEQQDIIFNRLLQEPSVKNLVPEIKRHGGLMDPILVRRDTMEVIEGNSRLAVYRQLDQRNEEGEWELIPCYIVSNLTDDQQVAFLNQIHVKGKTTWSAYEKANFAYVRKEQGWGVDKIAKLFGESKVTIRKRIRVIEMMKRNEDNQLSHFSYYEVMVSNREISKGIHEQVCLRDCLLERIKDLGSEEEKNSFTAQELRDKLPVILKKPKVLNKYIDGTIDLDEGYQRAKISHVEEKIKKAQTLLNDVSKREVNKLERNELNSLKQHVRKLSREVGRIEEMIESIEVQ